MSLCLHCLSSLTQSASTDCRVVAEVCRAYQTLLDMGVDSVTAAGSLRLHRVTSRNSPEFHECVMRCTAMVQDDTQARRPQAPSGAVLF